MTTRANSNSSGSGRTQLTAIRNNHGKYRIPYGNVDLPLFIIIMALLVMGIVMMFSASYAWAIDEGLEGTHYAIRQMQMAGGGLVCMFIASYFDYHGFQKLWLSGGLFLLALALLIAVLVIGDSTATGVTRWITIGPVQFQPSEIMKFAVIIFFSTMIVKNYERMNQLKYGILPYMAMLGVIAFLMLQQPHLSGTILILVIGVVLMFCGGANVWHFLGAGICGIIKMVVVVLVKKSYFMVRITTWLDPFNEATISGETWQTSQSLIAIGSGGFFGLGLGGSRQKYLYLPETKNDFVFSIVCEELGFVGAAVVVLLFVLLIYRGFYIAAHSRDKFGALVAIGITVQIGLQAFLNIAVVSNLIPNTGISLPFFSYGGTALIMQLAEMGVLLNVSRQANIEN